MDNQQKQIDLLFEYCEKLQTKLCILLQDLAHSDLKNSDIHQQEHDDLLALGNAKKKGIYKGRKLGATKAKPAQAQKLRSEGKKLKEIAAIMDTSLSTVQRYLKFA